MHRIPTLCRFSPLWLGTFLAVLGPFHDDPSRVARAQTDTFTSNQIEFFEKQVRPLLSKHCFQCHSSAAQKQQAGLLVDSRQALIEGGDSGPALVPGDPDSSALMEAVRWESYEMPPKGKLPDEDLATLERWIRLGAPWPPEETPSPSTKRPEFNLSQRASDHWVWQPIQNPDLPQVQRKNWPTSDLDHFVLSKLEANDLAPTSDANRSAILRRLYFDLIGLPPSPEETERFLADSSPDAVTHVVDTLLGSKHFGERWGRHWLDLVRYAESRGHEFDDDAVNAYQYRDYVIRAFNADVPYDQLVREHIAGDLLPHPRLHPERQFNESVLGTGFWFLGEWVHSPVDILKDESDRFDNMIDVMSKTFLGVTVSCARCHDHKFDAISTADYYSLTGFLQSSDYRQVRFESMEQNRHVARQISRTDDAYQLQVRDLLAQHELSQPRQRPPPKPVADLLVFDYQRISDHQFIQDGYLFGDGPRRVGEPWLDINDHEPENQKADPREPKIRFATRGCAVNDPIWDGLKSVQQSGLRDRCQLTHMPRSGRTLRTPSFELTGTSVACRVQGEGHLVACVDSHRHIAGPLHGETIKTIKAGNPWVVLNLSRYIGHRIHLEFTPAKDRPLKLFWVVQGSSEQTQQIARRSSPEDESAWQDFSNEVDQKAGDDLRQLAIRWANDRTKLRAQIVKTSHTAMAMLDGTGEDAFVYIRGNSSKPGKREPRHFLTAIVGQHPMKIQRGSGRLELAKHINDPSNPLTARVIVNRI